MTCTIHIFFELVQNNTNKNHNQQTFLHSETEHTWIEQTKQKQNNKK